MKSSFKKILLGFCAMFFLWDLSAMYSVETAENNRLEISYDGKTILP